MCYAPIIRGAGCLDLDGDATVGLADLTQLLSGFGCDADPDLCLGDTDLGDLTLLLANVGHTCP